MSSGPEYIDETHQRIVEFADEFLEDDERDGFIDGMMERRGYQRATHWTVPDQQQGGKAPLIKPRGGGQQRQRQQPAGQQRSGSYWGGK